MKNIKTKISVMALAAVMGFSTIGAALVGCESQGSAALKEPQSNQTTGSTLGGGSSSGKYSETTSSADRSNIFKENYDPDVVLVNDLSGNEEYSAVVTLKGNSLSDQANENGETLEDYLNSFSANKNRASISSDIDRFVAALQEKGIDASVKYRYDTLLKGVSVRAKGAELNKISKMSGVESVVVSERYDAPQALEISNDTNVYSTGIYNTSGISSDLRGNGMVIAVVDTGMDIKHAVFQEDNFYATEFAITAEDVESKLPYLKATQLDTEASTETLYVSSKLPFAFDYADKDTNVFPSYSSHGIHVAGIIAGNYTTVTQEVVDSDDELRFEKNDDGEWYFEGAAPDAQIVTIKTFTDNIDDEGLGGAETTDILAGLEDAATLNVDVINMSLGSSGGFSKYADDYMEIVYERIREAGISLICAASNDYSSGYGGANGTNLTSNPDSATVGSPSTYPAALSVASINGQKDPYMLANDETMVFYTEASDGNSNKMDFVSEIFDRLKATGYMAQDATSVELQYVVIPGLGRSYNYSASIVEKLQSQPSIAVVQRGTNTFEEKMKIAKENGALAIIICNNVAGKINMTVGAKDHAEIIPTCSTTMDIGNQLRSNAVGSVGKIVLDTSFESGPFMSDFSSWGPTPSLELKPEITSYGGNVTSSVANGYDVYSGTSMATPNVAGAITIVRQYLKKQYPKMTNAEINNRAYQLMMSTAGIVLNESGDPYSPRKQGAGIADIEACLSSQSYLYVKDAQGVVSSKTKIELGDDPKKVGVYDFTFYIENTSSAYAQYNVVPYVMTETVSSDGRTVAEKSYMLDDAIVNLWIDGKASTAKTVTVRAGGAVAVRVQIRLTDADREYLDKNFSNGMYIEGFVALTQKSSGLPDAEFCDLSIPFLAFYGDWAAADMLDYSVFEIAENEADDSIPDDEKLEVQFYSTTPYSKYQDVYVLPMGTYLYAMSDDMEKVYASEDKAAISMYNEYNHYTTYEFYAVYLGLMRGMGTYRAYIVNEYTQDIVWEAADSVNLAKGYANGGSTRPGYLKVEFDPTELDLAGNTKYHFYLEGWLDYGDGTLGNKNKFDFTFYTDYESPTLVDYQVRFEEYVDSNEETQTRIYLDVTSFDNHYVQALLLCYVDDDNYMRLLTPYATPVYADRVGETVTTSIEITDYYEKYYDNMRLEIEDYAMNFKTYTLDLDSAITFPESLSFEEKEVNIGLYEAATPTLVCSPSDAQHYDLIWESLDPSVAVVQDGEIFGVGVGTTYVAVYASNSTTLQMPSARVKVTVTENGATLSSKYTGVSFDVIADKDGTIVDPTNRSVEVHPNEDVQLTIKSDPWYLPLMQVEWTTSNPMIATVDSNGKVHTLKEGSCTIKAQQIDENGGAGIYSASVFLEVGPEYVISSYYLTEYHGVGGDVVVPEEINFMYIDEECFMDDTTITSIVIPDNVSQIGEKAFYGCINLKSVTFCKDLTMVEESAFEGCTALETIDMTDTLSTIFAHRAFYGCRSLKEIVRSDHLTAVWNYTFAGCSSLRSLDLSNLMQVGKYSFANCTGLKEIEFSKFTSVGEGMFFGCIGLEKVELPCTEIGKNAFYACNNLTEVVLSGKVKLLEGAFRGCTSLNKLFMVGDVYSIGDRAFEGCTALSLLVLPDCATTIGTDAFYRCDTMITLCIQENTSLTVADSFRDCDNWKNIVVAHLEEKNGGYQPVLDADKTATNYYTIENGAVYSSDKTELVMIPVGVTEITVADGVTTIGDGLFYGKKALESITLPVTLEKIGDYAFAYSGIRSIEIPASVVELGVGAFSYCYNLQTVTFAQDSLLTTIPEGCFNTTYALKEIALPKGVSVIRDYAFGESGLATLYRIGVDKTEGLFHGKSLNIATIGEGAFTNTQFKTVVLPRTLLSLGDGAFRSCAKLTSLTFSSATEMGEGTFMETNSLEEVTFASGMTSTGDYTFASIVGNARLQKVTLPQSIAEIGDYAFYNCFALETIALPKNVSYIGAAAFYQCANLSDIDLSYVQYINSFAFYGADSLQSAELESTLVIGYDAFYQSGLETVSLPVVTYIADGALAYTKLKKVDLPSSLTYVGAGVFHYDFYLEGISVAKGNKALFVDEMYKEDGVSYGTLYSVLADGSYQAEAYPGGNATKVYVILEGTSRINELAFTGSNSLQEVTCPVSLKIVGDKAFFDSAASIYTFLSYKAPTLEARYIDTSSLTSDDWLYEVFNYNGNYAEQKFYANFMYYAMYQYYGYYNFGLTLIYPENAVGYTDYIWTCYFQDVYSGDPTIDDATLTTIEMVKALASLEEIGKLVSSGNQTAAKARAEEISSELKAVRQQYGKIISAVQMAFFTGDYDGTDYYSILTAAENAMRPVKDHFGILTTVVGIELISTPDKMTYAEGEKIDFSGLKLLVTYDDGTTEYVDDYTVSTEYASSSGTRINISYGGYSTYFRITVDASQVAPPADDPNAPSDPMQSGGLLAHLGCNGSIALGGVALTALLPVGAVAVLRIFRKRDE